MSQFEKYKVDVPEGKKNSYSVKRFTVSQEQSDRDVLRAMINGSGRYVPPGDYTMLVYGNSSTIMSDTPDEIRDHLEPIRKAYGKCLVNGLGLGVVINGMLLNHEVEEVTCIEISPEVIELVAPHWQNRWGDRFKCICANAMDWKPPKGSMFNVVWHDIWPNICSDNLNDMIKLHRKYGCRCKWQGSWARPLCEHLRKHNI